MAQLALGLAGAAVGSLFGPIGASIGWSLGAALGATFEPNKQVYGPRLDNLHLSGSSYGAFITRGWGAFRAGANMIDQTDLVPTEHTSGGGKGGGGGTETHTFTYAASCDAGICEGPVGGVRKIWANGRLIYDTSQGSTVDNSGVPVTFYLGGEDQEADPTFEAERGGVGTVPAYRGMAHAVFENWEMVPFGNILPQLNFEIANERGDPAITELRYRDDLPMTWGGIENNAYLGDRYGPRIIAWPLVGTIEIENKGTRGGGVALNAETLDVISANLLPTEDTPTADFDNGDAPQYRYHYCGTTSDGVQIWLGKAQGGINFIVQDRSLYTGNDESSFPAISSIKPHWIDVDPTAGVDMRVIGSRDVAYDWGIPIGEVPVSVALSADRRMVFLMTISTPTLTGSGLRLVGNGTIDRWYKIIGGKIVARGTVDASAAIEFSGNFCHLLPYVVVASFENNYQWMWLASGITSTVSVFRIIGNVFAEESATLGGSVELWPFSAHAYPISGQPYYHNDPGSSRVGIPGTANDEIPTAEAPAVWERPASPVPYISIMASATDGYAGVAIYTIAATLRRFSNPQNSTTLDLIVGDLCRIAALDAGATPAQYDVSDLAGIVVIGFVLTQQMTAREAIEALMPVYFFDAVESDGGIKFVRRGKPSVATIPDDDLAAHTDSESIPALLTRTRTQEQDLPATMSLVYIDPDTDYQIGSQTSRRMIGNSLEVVTVQCPVVMNSTEAKQRLDALHFSTWFEREPGQWQTTRKYVYLEPTDVVTVRGIDFRITRKTEGADGVVKFEGVPSFGPTFIQTGSGGDSGSGFPPQQPPLAQLTDLVLLDIPYITLNPASGAYYPAMAGALRRSWPGASLQRSTDGGVNYSEVFSDNLPATIGVTTTALGEFFGGNIYDEVNSVTVVLKLGAGTLESMSREAAYNPEVNECVIGDEMLRFRTATLIAERTYRLSGLLRGRRGTEWAMRAHAAGENFVMLPLTAVAAGLGELHAPRQFKAVTFGSTVASANAVPFTYNAHLLLPYSPVYPMAAQGASGDWALRWVRRTRYDGEWIDYVDAGIGETSEAYIVKIWSDDTYATMKRSISASVQSATYTSAQQTSDFGSPQSVIYWTVAQVGAIGPGYDSLGRAPPGYSVTLPTAAELGVSRIREFHLPLPSPVQRYHSDVIGGPGTDEALAVWFTAPTESCYFRIDIQNESPPTGATLQRRFTVITPAGTVFTNENPLYSGRFRVGHPGDVSKPNLVAGSPCVILMVTLDDSAPPAAFVTVGNPTQTPN